MQKILENILENPVAWYGAIIATVSIIIGILNYLHDRAKVIVKFQKNMRMGPRYIVNSSPWSPEKDYFVITVVNKGRRLVKISKAGLKYYGRLQKPWVIAGDSVLKTDRTLTESNPATDFLIEQDRLNLEEIYFVWAEDVIGKVYKRYAHKLPTFWRWYYLLKRILR